MRKNAPITLRGSGLHSGSVCSVTLSRVEGPVQFVVAERAFTIRELQVERTDYGVVVAVPHAEFRVDLVEHLMAAFGGLSVYSGVAIRPVGPEIPLLGGGAAEFVEALGRLGAEASPSPLSVTRAARFEHGTSTYRFVPGERREIAVHVSFAGVGRQSAVWDGSPASFRAVFAAARTFGFARDAERLRSIGRAALPDPRAVVVLDEDGTPHGPAGPPASGELARHKLLDLVGDLYLYGGPPRGQVTAERPGHTATHAVVRRALECGVLAGGVGATLDAR